MWNENCRIPIDNHIIGVYLSFLSNGQGDDIQRIVNEVESMNPEVIPNSVFKVLKSKACFLTSVDFLYILKLGMKSHLLIERTGKSGGFREMKGEEVNDEIRRMLMAQWLIVSGSY